MSERIVTRIFCSKADSPHIVGTVVATGSGWRVRFAGVVEGVDGPTGRPAEMAANAKDAERAEAWCPQCSKRLELGLDEAAAAAEQGDKSMVLVAEGMWTDPLGVLDRRAVPPAI